VKFASVLVMPEIKAEDMSTTFDRQPGNTNITPRLIQFEEATGPA